MSSAMLSDQAPIDPDDELLVAYLDGELDRRDQADLETRLLEDETLRSRLQQLQTGWELLDDLPDPSPSTSMVQSTLELAVADIAKQRKQDSGSIWARFRTPILIVAACLLGALGSWGIAEAMRVQAYRRELADLAIAEYIDAYYYGSDLTLMRELAANPDWAKMVSVSREIGDIQVDSLADLGQVPIDEREAAIKNLPIESLNQLNLRWDRFTRMSDSDRKRIRRTVEDVAQQPDAERLLQTMQTYAVWRESLETSMRDGITSDDPSERRTAIEEAIEYTLVSVSKRSRSNLDSDTIESIYAVLQHITNRRIAQGDQATAEAFRRAASSPDPEYFAIRSFVGGFGPPGRGGGGRRGGGGPGGGPGGSGRGGGGPGGPGGERPDPLKSYELDMIYWALPDQALDTLDLISGGDSLLEAMTLRNWAEETLRRKSPFNHQQSSILERYNDLDEERRDAIDLLPRDDMLKELSPERRFRPPGSR